MASQRYNFGMALKEVIALIDAEIAALKEARAPCDRISGHCGEAKGRQTAKDTT
jgi:hypothetical protein